MDAETDGIRNQPSFEIDGFEPLAKLGSGGFGVVWKARQERIDRLVAIKVSNTVLENEEDLLFFDRECESLGRLSGNPNIVQVYTTGRLSDRRPYLVLEYIDGGTLTARLQKKPMPYDEIRQLGIDLCDGLAYAHRSGVLHRDIKPDNVFLRSTGSAVLGDFGIAQLLDTTKSRARTVIGSLRYIAPEVLKGDRPTASSDLYGVGITLYTAMSRKPPFSGQSNLVDQVMQQVLNDKPVNPTAFGYPTDLSDLVMSLLHKAADQRPDSAKKVAQQLTALPEVTDRRSPKPTSPPPPPVKKRQPKPDLAKTVLASTGIEELRPDGSKKRTIPNPRTRASQGSEHAETKVLDDKAQPGFASPELGGGGTKLYPEPSNTRVLEEKPSPKSGTLDATSVYTEKNTTDEPRSGPGGTRIFPTAKPTAEPAPPVASKPRRRPTPRRSTKPPPAPMKSPPVPVVASVLFEGSDHNTPAKLAEKIANNWDKAIASLSNRESTFFTEELTKAAYAWKRPQLPHLIIQFPSSPERRRHQLLTDLLIELDPQQSPTYRGYKIGNSHRRHASEFPPVVVDEIHRGEILIRWRRNSDMKGIVDYAQQWEQSIGEYDHRNQALNVADQNTGGKLLSAAGDPSAIPALKKALVSNPSYPKAGQQGWWAELYSSDSIATLLLAQETLSKAAEQTAVAKTNDAKKRRRRGVRRAIAVIVGLATLALSAVIADRWHMAEGQPVDRFNAGWAAVASVPFLVFWFLLATSNKRGAVAGGCLGSIAWLVYAASLTVAGAFVGMHDQLAPDTSSFGLFLTLASVTVPLVTFLVYRRLNSRLKL